MINRVAFTVYPVKEMDRAQAFYEGTLGLTHNSESSKGWVEYDLPGGGCFALTTYIQSQPSSTAGGMIAFEVDDLDSLMPAIEAAGHSFASEVIESPVCRMRVCLDPEGNGLLLHELRPKES